MVSADADLRVWLCRVTNPHEFEVDGISFLGTSGQNLDDIYKYSVEENRLTLLQRVLEWGHLVPTAPDTLTCYPLSDSDPFILQSAPHVFFVGNQPAYSSQMVTGTLLWNVSHCRVHAALHFCEHMYWADIKEIVLLVALMH